MCEEKQDSAMRNFSLSFLVVLILYSYFSVTLCLEESMKTNLISWVEILDFEINPIGLSNDLFDGRIVTNDPQMPVIDMLLQKSSNVFNSRLSHRRKDCLFEGHVTKSDDPGMHLKTLPVRLKFCSGDLAGLIFFDDEIWNVHTEPDRSWIMFANRMILKHVSDHAAKCGSNESEKNFQREELESISRLISHSDDVFEEDVKAGRERRSFDQTDKFVEIILFHDYEYYKKHGLSEETVSWPNFS